MSEKIMKFTVVFTCPMCGKKHYLYNVPEDLLDRVSNRRDTGEHIQDILKDYSPEDREKFITGYCDDCQKLMFAEPEDDEDQEASA